MSTFRNCETYEIFFSFLYENNQSLFSDELQPLCEGLDDIQPLFHGLGELDSDELSNAEACVPNQGEISSKVTIPVRNEEIYKATLVSLLNEDPQLSHDRYITFRNILNIGRHGCVTVICKIKSK